MPRFRKTNLLTVLYGLMVLLLAACSALPSSTQLTSVTPKVDAADLKSETAQTAGQSPLPDEHAMPAQANIPQTGKGQQVQVTITDNQFVENEVFIAPGTTVVWKNTGKTAHTVTADDGSFDSGELKPGATFQHTFEKLGSFIYHCKIHGSDGGHGMTGAVLVATNPPQSDQKVAALPGAAPNDPSAAAEPKGVQRVYYIAAVEVDWDYAPDGKNDITGEAFDDQANVFVANGPDRIGKVYTKAVYREFTDDTFTIEKTRPAEWQHLGFMGPVIHAEVGDTIVVHFMNKTRFPASMHPHGVFYKKDSEGAGYSDTTTGGDKEDDAVPTNGKHIYTWEVPERAGPGPMDPKSIMWMYHSHVDEPGDTNAGLMGAIIVSAKGNAKPDGTPKDVDREFVVTFSVMDENSSIYLQHNIDTKTGNPSSVHPDDEGFEESNLMHSINGYVYGNLPGLTMKKGERVRWYVMAMGTEVDLHTPHWHGNVVTYMGSHMDVIELMPASMKVVDMIPDDVGTWLLHCHVNDHILAGMQALYTVQP